MMKCCIYPNLKQGTDHTSNPYIKDFIAALNASGKAQVVNAPHKNPLISLLARKNWGKVYIFNWFESIPDYKYGPLQAIIACLLILWLKLSGRKVVWVLHNRRPHTVGYEGLKRFLARFISRRADLILTHSLEGVDLVKERYPYAAGKVLFLHHPTRNRLSLVSADTEKKYDLLIWGTVTPYKGVREFLDFVQRRSLQLRICVVGKCPSDALRHQLERYASPYVTQIFKGVSFEELAVYMAQSHFVLAPYAPQSILSSGMLMDSLSFGAKVIGPSVGFFNDYSHEKLLKVYTFRELEEIPGLVSRFKEESVVWEDYRKFLDDNGWNFFASRLMERLQQL